MKNNFIQRFDLRNKTIFIAAIILSVVMFTAINNYFFYAHVERSAGRDAEQLELILNESLKYFRENKISDKKYREYTEVLVKQFHEKAYYNKYINLNYQNAIAKSTGEIKKGYEPLKLFSKSQDLVAQYSVDITIPALNSDNNITYLKNVTFDSEEYFYSIFRSIFLSAKNVYEDCNDPEKGFKKALDKWWENYRFRSHIPILFAIIMFVVFFYIRKYHIELYREIERLEGVAYGDSNSDIEKIINCLESTNTIDGKNEELRLIIKNGTLLDTKNSDGMTALMQFALKKDLYNKKQEGIKLLIDNGANINTKNKSGLTALMLCSLNNEEDGCQILTKFGADINVKSEMTAFDLTSEENIRVLIQKSKNNTPQKLIKLLKNFTIDKPIKYTTHDWDFGTLKNEYGNFDGYKSAVKKQFKSLEDELQELSPNLYKKIYAFLIEENPNESYSWCHKTHINIGWSSLNGLKEHCDSGKTPDTFVLPNAIVYKVDFETVRLTTFKDIINLFKQEIEIRENFKNLEMLFAAQQENLGEKFYLDFSASKFNRQFYTDVEKFSSALSKIFSEIKIRIEYPRVEVSTQENEEDRSIVIKITQLDSFSSKSANSLLEKVINDGGDLAEIKATLVNICDWSVESSHEDMNFRVNFLHSNNVKEIEILDYKPKGFTHILRFYR